MASKSFIPFPDGDLGSHNFQLFFTLDNYGVQAFCFFSGWRLGQS